MRANIRIFVPNLVSQGLTISEILSLIQTDEHGYNELASDADQ